METTKRNHLQFCLLEHTCGEQTDSNQTKNSLELFFFRFQSLPSILPIPINLTSAHLKQNVFCSEDSIFSKRK